MKFKDLKIKDAIMQSINDLGFEELTPIQERTIPLIYDKNDVLGEAPTGTGKTFAYAIPMLENIDKDISEVQMLVLCPTRELALQSVAELRKLTTHLEGISCVPIYGGQAISRQITLLKKHPQIIVGTPGRLIDHLERRTVKLNNLKMLVLDECDEMLDMGFKPNIDKIVSNIKSEHQTILFSATISKEIKALSSKYQNEDAKFIKTTREENGIKSIKQKYILCKEEEKVENLINLLNTADFEKCFVFCRTKRKVEKIFKQYKTMPYTSSFLHGSLSQKKRDEAMKGFRNNEIKVLFVTDIAARGLDVNDVDLVINVDIPEQDEFYLHRIGRTGRANATGISYTFVTKAQKPMIKKYEEMTKDSIEEFKFKDNKEVKRMANIKYLEKIKEVTKEDLKEYEDAINEIKAKRNEEGLEISELDIAAALLKEATSRVKSVEASDEKRNNPARERRTERRREERESAPKMSFKSNPDAQRFFINIGSKDGADEQAIVHFVTKYCEAITKDDFSDIYIKPTFSFIELPKDKIDVVMEAINNQTFGKREVHIELSEKKPESNDSPKKYGRNGRVYNKDRGEGGYNRGRSGDSRGRGSRDGGSRDGGSRSYGSRSRSPRNDDSRSGDSRRNDDKKRSYGSRSYGSNRSDSRSNGEGRSSSRSYSRNNEGRSSSSSRRETFGGEDNINRGRRNSNRSSYSGGSRGGSRSSHSSGSNRSRSSSYKK